MAAEQRSNASGDEQVHRSLTIQRSVTHDPDEHERSNDAAGRRRLLKGIKEGRVDALFKHWSVEDIDGIVEAFCESFGLKGDEPLFKKAGRVLRDPDNWNDRISRILSHREQAALENEYSGFRKQPRMLKTSTSMFCVGAVVQGWSQIIGNGGNVGWPADLQLGSFIDCNPNEMQARDVWIFAVVNAATYFSACFVGCWLADPASDLFLGRRTPVFISGVFILAGSIGSACSQSWQQLLVFRILLGIGMGCKATVLPVYASEIAPSHLRATLVVNWQIFVALGICLGFATNLVVPYVDKGNEPWRGQNGALCIPTLILLILVYVSVESPRFQMRCKANLSGSSLRDYWTGPRGIWSGSRGLKLWLRYWLGACIWRPPPSGLFDNGTHESSGHQEHGQDEPLMRVASTGQGRAGSNTSDASRGSRARSGRHNVSESPNASSVPPGQQEDGPEDNVHDSVADARQPDYNQAFLTLVHLRGDPLLAAKELLYTHVQMIVEDHYITHRRLPGVDSGQLEQRSLEGILLSVYQNPLKHSRLEDKLSYFRKIVDLWRIPRLRRATGSAVVVMLSQQFCGVNVLIFYCTTLYARSDLCQPEPGQRNHALGLSLGVGVINFLFAIPAYWLIHRPGRRALLLMTLPFMTVFMLGACLGYEKSDDSDEHIKTLAAFTFLFMAVYSIGMGPVPFTLSSEVFPLEYRMVGMSLAVFANLLGAGFLALIVPPIYDSALENQGLLGIVTALNPLAFLFILLFVRETAGTIRIGRDGTRRAMSLEDLSCVFEHSTWRFLLFQWDELRPYVLKWPLRWWRNEKKPFKERPRIEEIPLDDLPSPATNGHAEPRMSSRTSAS